MAPKVRGSRPLGHPSLHGTALLLVAISVVTSCGRSYSLDCGPLDRATCEREAAEIVSVVTRYNPGRPVSSIVFTNAEGHAVVMLDDGTEIGWGERLGS